jgi:hypothetical protein
MNTIISKNLDSSSARPYKVYLGIIDLYTET